jgi:hypothetical protein
MYGPLCLKRLRRIWGLVSSVRIRGDWEGRARLVWGGERVIAGSLFFDAEGFLAEGRREMVARGR